ncbi:MAG: tetratricopeptide repeat protein [Ignavibacteriales bacterium]|nr:MAG: tetratricopeptide repeat protein [Ignavibacteriales bacterium]
MSGKAEELYKNKIRLIYEYNRKSPLFARIAGWELENSNYSSAIEILEEGLREYPDFPTPYFLLGKTYCKIGEYGKALKCYKKGSELIHYRETYHFYIKELESLKNLKTPPELRNTKLPEEKKDKFKKETASDFEDNLDELAEKISRAKIPSVQTSLPEKEGKKYISGENNESPMIVSETLAKIYIAQGEFDEALNVYEKLGRKDPAKKEYYSQKISELNLKKKESGN